MTHPLDLPETTELHKSRIQIKPFLKKWYLEAYTQFIRVLDTCPDGKKIEIGSGGGFFKTRYPQIYTSDILELAGMDYTFDAQTLPFLEMELSGMVMLNVFHHIPNPALFLQEANRCLKHGGKICMIEPANTVFSRFIYKTFHHEPFDEKGSMQIDPGRPLSNSNQAMAYIYFIREQKKLASLIPRLKLKRIQYYSPFAYLISGGLSKPALLPAWMYKTVRAFEFLFSPLNRYLAMFYIIELEAFKK